MDTLVNVLKVLLSMARPEECVGANTTRRDRTAMSVCRSIMMRRGAEQPH